MKTIPDGCYFMLTGALPTFWHWVLCVLAGGASGHKGLMVKDGRMYLWGFWPDDNKLEYKCEEVERLPDCSLIKTEFDYDYFKKALDRFCGQKFKRFSNNCFFIMLTAFGVDYLKIIY